LAIMMPTVLYFLAVAIVVPGAQAQAGCSAQEAKIKELTEQLQEAKAQNAKLMQKLATSSETPYMTTEALVDSFGAVTEFALSQGMMMKGIDVDLSAVYTAANASMESFQSASTQATSAVSRGYEVAKDAVLQAAELAQDLHGKHVSPHSDEYYKIAVETLEPARQVYFETVHPHLGKATETVYTVSGTVVESSKKLTPTVLEFVTQASEHFSKASQGPVRDVLQKFVEPREFVVLGRKLRFPHGYLDAGLAAVQILIGTWAVYTFVWKLFLKTLVWQIGVKLFGEKICLRMTGMLVKVTFKLVRIMLSILVSLAFSTLCLAFSLLMLTICSALGVSLLHGIEKGSSAGIPIRVRLAVGLCFGLLVYFFCQCKCCKRRKKEPTVTNGKTNGKTTNGKTNGHTKEEPKKATSPAPKNGAKQEAAKPKKK